MTSTTIEKKSSKAAERARRNKAKPPKPSKAAAAGAHVFPHGEAWLLVRPDGTVLAQAGTKRKASWRARQFDIPASAIVEGPPAGFDAKAVCPPSAETKELRALTGGDAEAAKPAKAKKERAAKAEGPKRVSALDAAATVLAGAKEPMSSKALIEAMAAKKLWESPGGKTPDATLYAAMVREINAKGKDSRFRKADKGLFKAA